MNVKNPLAAAIAASAHDAASQFVKKHADAIAAAERRHGLATGELIGAAWEAAHAHAQAGALSDDPAPVIQSAVYAAVRCIEEPVSRGSGSQHSHGVALESVPEIGDTDDPAMMIEGVQAVEQREAENEWHRRQMREAQRRDKTPPSGYRGRPIPLRTLERRRAEARVAQEHGQLEFFELTAAGWEAALDEVSYEVARMESIDAMLVAKKNKRSLIRRAADRITRMIKQLAFTGPGFDQPEPDPEPPRPAVKINQGWRKHRLPHKRELAVPAGWHKPAPMPGFGLAGGAV